MPIVLSNIVTGASVREIRGVVVESIDVAIVKDLAGGVGWAADALGTAGLPTANETHPRYADLTLRDRRIVPLSPNVAHVELVYRVDESLLPTAVTVRGSSRINSVQTTVDRNGDSITTSVVSQWFFGGVLFAQRTDTQTHNVDVTEAQRAITVQDTRSSDNPGVFTSVYVNKINSVAWQNGEPGTWFCSGIDYRIVNADASPPRWGFTYNFQHKAEGWQPVVTHKNLNTGRPSFPLNQSTVDSYEAVDFHNLELFPP